ncbi:unnamed protein product [Trichobilharzia szidati]|nr:unnamed protein product [Trichobilharzia szidati]
MTDNCKHVLKVKTSIQLGILSPEHWHCSHCYTTESVWACLSCSNFACGRYISEHALQHFKQTNHPLCIEVNEKFVYCYICDDFVLNDNAPGDIKLLRMALDAVTNQDFSGLLKKKRGRRILRHRGHDVEKNHLRLMKADDIQTAVVRHRISRLSWAFHLWWSRYAESKLVPVAPKKTIKNKCIPLALTPSFTGLRNLGNTCYMNSILQVLRHTAPFANYVMNHTFGEITYQSRKRHIYPVDVLTEDQIFPIKRPATYSTFSKDQAPTTSQNCGSLWNSSVTKVVSCCAPNSEYISLRDCKTNLGAPRINRLLSSRSSGGLNGGQCLKSPHERGRQPLPTSLIDPQTSPAPSPSLYEEVRNLFKLLWSGQKSIVSPTNLLNTVWSTLPNFKGYKQQDAQEFLSLLLDRLQTEVQGIPMAVPNNSCDFINRAFRGYCVSHVRCSTCQVIACTEEPIYELSLSLPTECYSDESCKCDVVDLLRQFVSPSAIDGASYACVKCNQCYAELIKKRIESTRSTFNEYIYDPSDQPYPVDKMVSIVLSRLASPPHSPRSSHPDFSTSCDLTETSSISESMLSNASSLTCIEEQCINPSVERSSRFLTPQSSAVNSPKRLALPTTKNSFLTHATQTIRLSKLPRVLRLHIKRFRWVGRQREKLTCHVSFPLILNMAEFMLSDANREECGQSHLHDKLHRTISQRIQEQMGSTESIQGHSSSSSSFTKEEYQKSSPQYLYHLTGVVVHHGRGFQSGHYTAYCLNDEPECWLHCNDANVSLCDFSEVAAAQAYLLFYSELMPRTPLPNWYKKHTVSESLSNTIPCSTSQPDIPNIHSVYSSSSDNYEKASKMCSPGC